MSLALERRSGGAIGYGKTLAFRGEGEEEEGGCGNEYKRAK